jgi:hypothetical protein
MLHQQIIAIGVHIPPQPLLVAILRLGGVLGSFSVPDRLEKMHVAFISLVAPCMEFGDGVAKPSTVFLVLARIL